MLTCTQHPPCGIYSSNALTEFSRNSFSRNSPNRLVAPSHESRVTRTQITDSPIQVVVGKCKVFPRFSLLAPLGNNIVHTACGLVGRDESIISIRESSCFVASTKCVNISFIKKYCETRRLSHTMSSNEKKERTCYALSWATCVVFADVVVGDACDSRMSSGSVRRLESSQLETNRNSTRPEAISLNIE